MIIKDTVLLTIKMNAIMTIILISKQTVRNQDQVAYNYLISQKYKPDSTATQCGLQSKLVIKNLHCLTCHKQN